MAKTYFGAIASLKRADGRYAGTCPVDPGGHVALPVLPPGQKLQVFQTIPQYANTFNGEANFNGSEDFAFSPSAA